MSTEARRCTSSRGSVTRFLVLAISSLGLLGLGSPATAQPPETGFLNRQVTVDGTAYRYQIFLPADYTRQTRWPVILFLHGAGERGTDGVLQTEVGLGRALRRDAARYPAIAVMPQAPPDTRWTGAPGAAAMAALDATLDEFSTDADRVYLTGLSLGGNGTWYLAYTYPDRFAALVPICGFVGAVAGRFPAFVSDATRSPYVQVAERIRDIPTWIFHGEIDSVVPVSESRDIAQALRDLGSPVTYSELPGTNHNSWDAAYASPGLTDWLFEQRRQ